MAPFQVAHAMSPTVSTAAIWRPHVTVACVVNDGARYLMVEEEAYGRLGYNQPAGHLEDHERLADAARRETLEETGWTVEPTHLIGIYQWHSTEHGEGVVRCCLAARAVAHDPARPLDSGIHRALWLTREEIAALGPRLRSPLILASIDEWLAGARLPLATLHWWPDPTASCG